MIDIRPLPLGEGWGEGLVRQELLKLIRRSVISNALTLTLFQREREQNSWRKDTC